VSPEYRARRAEIEAEFAQMVPVEGSLEMHSSPSGRYVLETLRYAADEQGRRYARGTVRRLEDDAPVADIERNIGGFLHAWVQHPDGLESLLCGEDYQGYTVVCLDTAEARVHFPPEAFGGHGFCWAAIHPSPDGSILAVEGCYWACPYELVMYDFSDPRAFAASRTRTDRGVRRGHRLAGRPHVGLHARDNQ
jgi:hypothetical protein